MYDITAAPIVRAVREEAGLSQRALAKRAHTTQAAVARIEAGASTPSLNTLRRLVSAAGYEIKLRIVRQPAPDPVVEAYKPGVDQTLLIENLRKTPEQRMQTLVAMARLVTEMQRARRVAERKR